MSFFATIIKDLETFASKVEGLFGKILGEAPTFEKILATTLEYVGPVLQTVVSLTAGAPAGALVGNVIATAQKDLAVVSGLVSTIGPQPSVQGILNGVVGDLGQLLGVIDVKDAKTAGLVQLVLKELQALANAFPAPAVAAVPAALAAPAPAVQAVAAAPASVVAVMVPAPVAVAQAAGMQPASEQVAGVPA